MPRLRLRLSWEWILGLTALTSLAVGAAVQKQGGWTCCPIGASPGAGTSVNCMEDRLNEMKARQAAELARSSSPVNGTDEIDSESDTTSESWAQ